MRIVRSNPIFNKILNGEYTSSNYEAASYSGIAKKTFFYIGMVILGALLGIVVLGQNPALGSVMLMIAAFTTFIFGIVAMLMPRASKVAGTIYCIGEGMLVGVISLVYEMFAEGAVLSALVSTFVVFVIVATLYLTRIVRVTNRFVNFLFTFAIAFIFSQLVLFIISLFSGFVFGFGLAMFISLISVFLATLYLFFDLEQIRQVVEGGQPKEMEWYASFGLVFTLVWLYIEILRIIAIFANRD